MARISRATQKIFGSTATDIGTFGSAAAGSPVSGANPSLATVQSLSQFLGGWDVATLGASKFPAIEDMNALEYLNSTQLAYLLQQGIAEYDAGTTYYTNNIVAKAGTFQLYGSLTDSNVGNALTSATNWQLLTDLSATSGWSTGDVKMTIKTVADSGWVLCNDGSIGDASSGGSTRANADTSALFTLLWNNISNTYAPVSTGRGANAAADFAAHKNITLFAAMGRALGIYGSGSGLTARTMGQILGEELHVLVTGELAAHNHTINVTDPTHNHTGTYYGVPAINSTHSTKAGTDGTAASSSLSTDAASTGITATSVNTGSGTGHNTMQPTTFLNAMIKL